MKKTLEKIKKAAAEGGVFTFAALGDSVTQGCFEVFLTGETSLDTVRESKNAYPAKLKEMLNALYPYLRVNMINAGVSGDDTVGGLNRLDRDVLKYSPDFVIVSYGLNDCALTGIDGADKYADNLGKIFKKIKKTGADCVYLTQNYMDTEVSPQIREPFLRKLAEDFAKLQNDGTLKSFYEKGKETAVACGVETVDLYGVWEKMEKAGVKVNELLSNKLNHPVREYHNYIAVKILENILGV